MPERIVSLLCAYILTFSKPTGRSITNGDATLIAHKSIKHEYVVTIDGALRESVMAKETKSDRLDKLPMPCPGQRLFRLACQSSFVR